MDFSKLEKNIVEVLRENQLKLGYAKETVRLYYPLQSLHRFLATDCGLAGMEKGLEAFVDYTAQRLGKVDISHKGERFCFRIPPEGNAYVHEHMGDTAFLQELIQLVQEHGKQMEDVFAIFHRYSEKVQIQEMDNGEFDYLVWFEDGKPDEFKYCLKDEGFHITYHRYTPEDYEDLFPTF